MRWLIWRLWLVGRRRWLVWRRRWLVRPPRENAEHLWNQRAPFVLLAEHVYGVGVLPAGRLGTAHSGNDPSVPLCVSSHASQALARGTVSRLWAM